MGVTASVLDDSAALPNVLGMVVEQITTNALREGYLPIRWETARSDHWVLVYADLAVLDWSQFTGSEVRL